MPLLKYPIAIFPESANNAWFLLGLAWTSPTNLRVFVRDVKRPQCESICGSPDTPIAQYFNGLSFRGQFWSGNVSAMKARVYSYSKCSTCQNAEKFLEDRGIEHEVIPIKETPPNLSELKTMVGHVGSIRKLFNTSGLSYKALNLKDRLKDLSESEALSLLVSDGMLVKRPFVLTSLGGAVGFKAEAWEKLFKTPSA